MKHQDPALTISTPRLLAAIYFGLLSVVGTVLINAFLTLIGIAELIPLFKAIILGVVVAGATGALFGDQIVHCKKPYKLRVFYLGFIMVIASLPVFDLGLFAFMMDNGTLPAITQNHTLLVSYVIVVAYSYILFGIKLAVAAGLAAMYLRGKLVYDILHTYKPTKLELPPEVEDKHHHRGI